MYLISVLISLIEFKMQEKHERMKNLKSLRDKESKLCERLCLPAHNLGEVNVPTKEQLKELEANVDYLQKEQVSKLNLLNNYFCIHEVFSLCVVNFLFKGAFIWDIPDQNECSEITQIIMVKQRSQQFHSEQGFAVFLMHSDPSNQCS